MLLLKKNMIQKTTENSQVDSIDLNILNSLKQIAKNLQFESLSTADQIIETSKLFLQTPYVAGTLENIEKEELVVNLHQLDCTTYLENVLALSQSLKKSQANISDFSKNLELPKSKFKTSASGKLCAYVSKKDLLKSMPALILKPASLKP